MSNGMEVIVDDVGDILVPVLAKYTEVTIAVPAKSGNHVAKFVDEFGYNNFAFYGLAIEQPKGIDCVVTPITDDGSVGCQHVQEFPLGTSERNNWSEEDNIDNGLGSAFRCYRMAFDAPPEPGLGFTVLILRFVKYYYSIRNPAGSTGSGKYDRARGLTVKVIAQDEKTFAAYVARMIDHA